MFNFLKSHRSHNRITPLRRFFRPLVEGLESRDLLAFNLSISATATANVSSTTVNGTTTFLATGSGANLNVADINGALSANNNVVIDSGAGGLQAGTISSNGVPNQVLNTAGQSVTIRNGFGIGSQNGDITLAGLTTTGAGSLIIDANQNVNLSNTFNFSTITITAGTGSISMPTGGSLQAQTLNLTAGNAIGSLSASVFTAAATITATAGAGGVFITEANDVSLTATASGAGGRVILVSQNGTMTIAGATGNSTAGAGDAIILFADDGLELNGDLAAGAGTVSIFANQDGSGANDFSQGAGAVITTTNQTGEAVLILVNTPLGGTGIADLRAINAGTTSGVVTVNAHGGPILDAQIGSATNITAFQALLVGQFIGSVANPLDMAVSVLETNTSATNGNQNLRESNGLTELSLNAGTTGDITLTLAAGAIQSADATLDIAGEAASITAPGGFGVVAVQINTSVSSLTVDTSGGSGDQAIVEADGLAALDLNAGGAPILLIVSAGAVSDADALTDITGGNVSIGLNDSTKRDFGSLAQPIGTSVNGLGVSTFNGNGDQFINEANGLTLLSLAARTGNATLNVLLGAVSDTDPQFDVTATSATLTLSDPTAKNFGSAANPIHTSADGLTVNTSAGAGSQFITEDNGLTGLNLNASGGDVTLFVTTGAVTDSDGDSDITADGAIVQMDDPTARNFGAQANSIETDVNSLAVFTNGGGDQFIVHNGDLAALNLVAAASGDIVLVMRSGAVSDTDAASDIEAARATIRLTSQGTRNFGSAVNPVRTSVDELRVETSDGGGSQFIVESNGLSALDLDSGLIGDPEIRLTLTAGNVLDADDLVDIRCGGLVTIVLSDATAKSFGVSSDPIETVVSDGLSVSTAAGGGSQFIHELNGLGGLSLNAGAGDVTLVLPNGAVADTDPDVDIIADTAVIALADAINKSDFGSLTDPIETNVNILIVSTEPMAGDQFISEADSTTVPGLNAGTGNITLVGGTFELEPNGAIGDMSTLTVNSPAIVNLSSSSETVGGLAGDGTVAFKADGQGQNLLVGGNNASTTFLGTLTGIDAAIGESDALQKVGTGTLTLSGNNTLAGLHVVFEGKVLVTGTIAGRFTVNGAEAILGGTGTIAGRIQVGEGHLAPGTSTGVLSSGDLLLSEPSTFDVEITNANANGGFDRAIVTGQVTITTTGSGVALNTVAIGNVNLQVGQQLAIITNDGSDAVQGTFKGLAEGAKLGSNFLGSGLTATISYLGFTGTQNDVVLTMSPGSLFPWHNETKPFDIGGGLNNAPDDHVVAGDALDVINYLNAFGAGEVPGNAVLGLPFGFLDADGDNFVTAGDALDVINFLNAGLGGEGEASAEMGLPNAAWQAGVDAAIENEELIALLAVDMAEAVRGSREDKKERAEITEFLAGRERVFGFTSGWINTRESVGGPRQLESFSGGSSLGQAQACETHPAATSLLHFADGEVDWLTGSSSRDWVFANLDGGELEEFTDFGNDEDNEGL